MPTGNPVPIINRPKIGDAPYGMRLRQSIGSGKKVKAGEMRYGIFAVSPVSDSSEAERRQANRASSSAVFVIVILRAEKDLMRPTA